MIEGKVGLHYNTGVKCRHSVSCSVKYNSLQPHGLQPTRILCPWDFPVKNPGVGKLFPSPGDPPDPRIKLRSPALQVDSFPPESLGKPYFRHKVKSESEVAQSCPILCDPMDCSLPGFSVHGIFQARIMEWVAISFSRRSSCPRDWTRVSRIVGRHFHHLNLIFKISYSYHILRKVYRSLLPLIILLAHFLSPVPVSSLL